MGRTIKYYSVDIDLENGDNIRDLEFDNLKKAMDAYAIFKKRAKYNGEPIQEISLLAVYEQDKSGKLEDYETIRYHSFEFENGGNVIMKDGGELKSIKENIDTAIKKYSYLLEDGSFTFQQFADKINKSADSKNIETKELISTLKKFPYNRIQKNKGEVLYQEIKIAPKKEIVKVKRYTDTFENVSDIEDEKHYVRNFAYVETEKTKNIQLLVVAQIRDLTDAIPEKDLPKEGSIELTLSLIPNEDKVARKLKLEINSPNHSISSNFFANFENYVGGLRYNPEDRHHFKTFDEAEEYLLSEYLNDEINSDSKYTDNILYGQYNRAGDTNYKILQYFVGERDRMFKDGGVFTDEPLLSFENEIKEWYIPHKGFFAYANYDIKRISNLVKIGGGENIHTEFYRDWSNQPEVVVFTAHEAMIDDIAEIIKNDFKSDYSVSIYEKDWKSSKDFQAFMDRVEKDILKNYLIDIETLNDILEFEINIDKINDNFDAGEIDENGAIEMILEDRDIQPRKNEDINKDTQVYVIKVKDVENDYWEYYKNLTDVIYYTKEDALKDLIEEQSKKGEEYDFYIFGFILDKNGKLKKEISRERIDRPYKNGGKVIKRYSKGGFSQSFEENLKENLLNGEISCVNLQGIIGRTPDYPYQVVGSITLKKCFLRPYYTIKY